MTSNERHEPDFPSEPQDALAGSRRPVEDLPQGEERRNPARASARTPAMTILLALVAGVIAGLVVSWATVETDGNTWLVPVAAIIVVAVGALRGFESAIAASIAASATVTGLWIWRAMGDDGDLWDSLVTVLFVGVGTLLALIVLGGISAAVAQAVRHRRKAK